MSSRENEQVIRKAWAWRAGIRSVCVASRRTLRETFDQFPPSHSIRAPNSLWQDMADLRSRMSDQSVRMGTTVT